MNRTHLVVIGAGNMGRAVIQAAWHTRRGTDRLIVAEPDAAKRSFLKTEYSGGLTLCERASEALAQAGGGVAIVVAVKPQMFASVASEIVDAKALRDDLIISIMAGVTAQSVYERLGGGRGFSAHIRIVRAMPNLPMAYGEGITAICAGPGGRPADLDRARDFFDPVVKIDESLMDAFTAVASSGPAYVFYLAEAMERAAGELGFGNEQARTIVRQTLVGAAEMMRERNADNDPLGVRHLSSTALRERVTSRGGTTAAAVDVLEAANVKESVVRAIKAAAARGAELGRG